MKCKACINEIYLIDDDRVLNLVHSRLLQKDGFKNPIRTFNSGDEALIFLEEAEEHIVQFREGKILLLLDLNMPGLNGWEFLNIFRELPISVKDAIEIFILTSSYNPDDRGMISAYPEVSHFLNKPLSPDLLKEVCHESC